MPRPFGTTVPLTFWETPWGIWYYPFPSLKSKEKYF